MNGPIDAIVAIHNAFRRDMAAIDAAALAVARGKTELMATVNRFRFMNEVLDWHAHGEEKAIFPILEEVAPSVAEAYENDHRGLDRAFEALGNALAHEDVIGTARASAAFKFHLDIHLDKEDSHLYRIVRQRVSVADQANALGIMAAGIPADRNPEFIAWMFPLLGNVDRENMTRTWQMVMPAEVFAGATKLVKNAIGPEWVELKQRIPELAA